MEFIKIISLGIPIMFIATVLYVNFLLMIAKVTNGALKMSISLILYTLFAVVIVLPLFYLIKVKQPAIQESSSTHVAVMVSYIVMVAPGLYYLGKVKIKELQSAGYFLPRK